MDPDSPWTQLRGRRIVSLVNSHTNAASKRLHLLEIDLRFAPGLRPGWRTRGRRGPAGETRAGWLRCRLARPLCFAFGVWGFTFHVSPHHIGSDQCEEIRSDPIWCRQASVHSILSRGWEGGSQWGFAFREFQEVPIDTSPLEKWVGVWELGLRFGVWGLELGV
jgi:hypothetical protein